MSSPLKLQSFFGAGDDCLEARLPRELLSWIVDRSNAAVPPGLREPQPACLAALRQNLLTPMVYQQVKRRGLTAQVSPTLCQWLEHDYALALKRGLRQDQEALAVIRTLTDAGLEVMLLKGADLRLRLYGDPAVRPMVDMDIMVPPRQVEQASGRLEALGFRLQARCFDPRPGWRARFRNALHFESPPGRLLMTDLHWELNYICRFYRLPYYRLQDRAISAEYHGCPVKLLSSEHLLIHLGLQIYAGPQHALRIIDLAGALSLPLDWPRFLEEVARFNCQRPLLLILRDLFRIFPQKVPPFVLERLSQDRPSWVEQLALRRSLGFLTGHAVTLAHHLRFRDWRFYLWGLLWPQTEYLEAMQGSPDRPRFIRQLLRALVSKSSELIKD